VAGSTIRDELFDAGGDRMSDGTIVMVGTRKGLWVGRSDEAR
jgi:hypothetical protein